MMMEPLQVLDRCTHSCICGVSGADSYSPTYQWMKDGSDVNGEDTSILSFSSLKLSDAGQYCTCQVTVNSTYLK